MTLAGCVTGAGAIEARGRGMRQLAWPPPRNLARRIEALGRASRKAPFARNPVYVADDVNLSADMHDWRLTQRALFERVLDQWMRQGARDPPP